MKDICGNFPWKRSHDYIYTLSLDCVSSLIDFREFVFLLSQVFEALSGVTNHEHHDRANADSCFGNESEDEIEKYNLGRDLLFLVACTRLNNPLYWLVGLSVVVIY